MLRATTACTLSTAQLPKVLRHCGAFSILTSKCDSRHSRVHYIHISTSKRDPRPRCFQHFDFETRFAPQLRAIFDISSRQMASRPPLYRSLLFNSLQHWKNRGFCDFATFSRSLIFFVAILSSLTLSSVSFSDCSYHCCCICP